ncbi:unnamed protein product [Fusarium graminearum]|uniref:Uncharacterized protein n=1 Tax=Gibberella zeae TaxID=5518 RepID=A0A4E9EAH3_GIBZA|nr:unnamed protein product [Fusarium graminearum]CAF3546636.1 unnamed protein product [Fusarium graminearum]CAG1965334.1 unnamed protein product [Fusarium graminearum]CAG2010004.1 unnamed protein product [Fusarium graminearum]
MAAGASVIVEPESSPFKSRQEWTAIHVGSEVGVEEFGLKVGSNPQRGLTRVRLLCSSTMVGLVMADLRLLKLQCARALKTTFSKASEDPQRFTTVVFEQRVQTWRMK